mgnify:CR=1 FL=1
MTDSHVPFQTVIEALLDGKDFPRRYIQYFSDIDPASLSLLMQAWPKVKPSRKRSLLKQMEAYFFGEGAAVPADYVPPGARH